MIRFAMIMFAAVAILTGRVLADDKAKAIERDLKALQGVWIVKAAYENGEKLTKIQREGKDPEKLLYALEVEKGKYRLVFEPVDKPQLNEADFTLDPSSRPNVVEFSVWWNEGKKNYGVYSVEGDKLTLCFNLRNTGDRSKTPKKLETKQNDGNYMFVLEKK